MCRFDNIETWFCIYTADLDLTNPSDNSIKAFNGYTIYHPQSTISIDILLILKKVLWREPHTSILQNGRRTR